MFLFLVRGKIKKNLNLLNVRILTLQFAKKTIFIFILAQVLKKHKIFSMIVQQMSSTRHLTPARFSALTPRTI